MKLKIWIWTSVLAFLGYAIAGKGAIESGWAELIGLLVGALIGLLIGLALQRYDDSRKRPKT